MAGGQHPGLASLLLASQELGYTQTQLPFSLPASVDQHELSQPPAFSPPDFMRDDTGAASAAPPRAQQRR
jgi:hypothetical protein